MTTVPRTEESAPVRAEAATPNPPRQEKKWKVSALLRVILWAVYLCFAAPGCLYFPRTEGISAIQQAGAATEAISRMVAAFVVVFALDSLLRAIGDLGSVKG
jgi:hypothetical protein